LGSQIWFPKLLVVLTRLAALLLTGLVSLALRILALRILLLLTWLLATALLAGVLALLARLLVLLVRHGGTPLLDVSAEITVGIDFGCSANPVPRSCGNWT
jgi:hypothetical protein